MDAIRDPLPVAVPAFHGDRMDVPRRLRPSGLPGPAQGQCESSIHDTGNLVAPACPCHRQHGAIPGPARCHVLLRGGPPESRVPVLWVGIRTAAITGDCTATSRGVDTLSSIVARTKRDVVQSGQKLIRFVMTDWLVHLFSVAAFLTEYSCANRSRRSASASASAASWA